DIGLIVFDHGKAIGNKRHAKEFLIKDYDFYCSGGYLYVYSSKGNPAKMFKDIEFCHHEHIVKMKSNSTIQNWRIMYGGSHGISTGGVEDIVVDSCVVGYIGGTYQMSGKTVRFGNGIEVWGGCDGYTIKNCHVYQCYDAGITMQFQGATEKTIIEQNILFDGNLLELNNYNIEYFLSPEPNGDSTFKNVSIKNNIVRGGGYGWGFYSRPDREYGCNVMGGGYNTSKNFVYTNNIFDHAKCHMLTISAGNAAWLPVFTGNTYAQYRDLKSFEYVGGKYYVSTQGNEVYTERLGDKTAKIILY
ncbi:MAG: right-handed parallel beta-helix repeat-containing protein, partial [Clostridia bacterium]|nr:right-handed parallel beta-helix repeat-containing protein [Clostridia bacterium]